uniref:HypA2 n=1 Tax=Cupriavidus necator TaxID=106590 RepID=O07449_CUPNE|nr:HypA2 [Cupriavidus necator H16]
MHEMSLAVGVLQIVEDVAHARFSRVTAVRLEIGRLSSIEPEALLLRGGSARQCGRRQPRLEIVDTPGAGWCLHCSETVAIGALYDPCAQCGGIQVQPTGGTEMRVMVLSGVTESGSHAE